MALALAIAVIALAPGSASADALAEARAHFAAGERLYSAGDYRGAIAEFAKADALAPSPILQFNIALCYEKLGDTAEALRRYELYLRELPDAHNRAQVEAKIRALKAALSKPPAKARAKAPVAKAPPRTPPAEAAPPAAAPPAGAKVPADPSSTAVSSAKAVPAEALSAKAPPAKATSPGAGETAAAKPPATATTPQASQQTEMFARLAGPGSEPVRDPALLRVSRINVAQVRDARHAAGFTGHLPDPSSGEPDTGARYAAPAQPEDSGDDDPIYTKWWFWGIAAAGAVLLYQFATTDSGDSDAAPMDAPPPSGPALIRF